MVCGIVHRDTVVHRHLLGQDRQKLKEHADRRGRTAESLNHTWNHIPPARLAHLKSQGCQRQAQLRLNHARSCRVHVERMQKRITQLLLRRAFELLQIKCDLGAKRLSGKEPRLERHILCKQEGVGCAPCLRRFLELQKRLIRLLLGLRVRIVV